MRKRAPKPVGPRGSAARRRTASPRVGPQRPQAPADVRGGGACGHGAKSEAVRGRAILALLSERTYAAAAVRCGVNEKTLRRWVVEDESFKRELAQARSAMFEEGMNRTQALAAQAIDTLATLMGRTAPPAVRLGAARTVVELGIQRHDADTILRRLNELEAHQRERGGSEGRR